MVGQIDEAFNDLNDALSIRGPHSLKNAPNAYAFRRKRAISTDNDFWGQILTELGITTADVLIRKRRALRTAFERSWGAAAAPGLSQAMLDANIYDLKSDWGAYVQDAGSVYTTTRAQAVDTKFFIFDLPPSNYRVPPYASKAKSLVNGCVLRMPLGNSQYRWFYPLIDDYPNVPKPATKADFSLANWSGIWDRIQTLVHVYFEVDPGNNAVNPTRNEAAANVVKQATRNFSALDIIRADAALIEQQYIYLDGERLLAGKLNERANKLLTDILPTAPISSIPSITLQYRDLNAYLPKVEVLRRRLADAASNIGYKLFLEKTHVTYADQNGADQGVDLEPGKLFKAGTKTVSWTTFQTVTNESDFLFFSDTTTYQVPVQHSKSFTFYERATIDYDPWTEAAEAYRQQGYSVYLFQETGEGLRTADGSGLNDIVDQCRADESFRCGCVIGVPVYEYAIVGERLMIGYVLLVRPLPQIISSSFPLISVDEQLSYKFAWKGVSLGELAATIPLSPGEERTVTVAVSQKVDTSRTVTTSSLTEVTQVDKSDFETVFEKEVRQEHESTSSSTESLGGSYMGITGSASFSQGTSTKDVSRQLNRSVQKASQELTRRSKEETTISVSEKTETSTSTSTSYKVRNVNEGRTLNINFYRLMNNFESNLYMEDFDFSVEAGPEIVMGSKIRQSRGFSRTGVDKLFNYLLQPGVMPIDLSDKQEEFKIALCKALTSNMVKEYGSDDGVADHAAQVTSLSANLSASAARIVAGLEVVSIAVPPALAKGVLASGTSDAKQQVNELLKSTFSTANCSFDNFLNRPFEKATFAYDSGGLYADAQVGLRPATEEYSERMREMEVRKKDADQRLVLARANYLESKSARNLISIDQIINKDKVYASDRTVLYESDGHVSVAVRLSTDLLPSDGWQIQIKGGGSYLQDVCSQGGIIKFRLPRIYAGQVWDLGNKAHQWFAANVTINNNTLRLSLAYKIPATP